MPRPRLVLTASLLVAALAIASNARADVLTGEDVVLEKGDTVEKNFYASGERVTLRGDVLGDAVVAGGEVTIDGDVHGDVLAAGGRVNVTGNVAGDVRAIAGNIVIDGVVDGDVAFAGGMVTLRGATAGDVFIAGGRASVEGDVGGSLYVGGGEVHVHARVGDGAIVQAGRLVLHNAARIQGDLWYTGDALERAAGAVVTGEVVEAANAVSKVALRGPGLIGWLQGVIGLSLFGLVWLFVSRSFAQRTMATLRDEPGFSVGIGAAAMLAAPFAIALLLVVGAVVGGWWIALFALALSLAAVALAVPVVAALVGREVLMGRMKLKSEAIPMVLMIAVLGVVKILPIFGALITLIATLFGVGALVVTAVRMLRPTRARGTAPPAVTAAADAREPTRGDLHEGVHQGA